MKFTLGHRCKLVDLILAGENEEESDEGEIRLGLMLHQSNILKFCYIPGLTISSFVFHEILSSFMLEPCSLHWLISSFFCPVPSCDTFSNWYIIRIWTVYQPIMPNITEHNKNWILTHTKLYGMVLVLGLIGKFWHLKPWSALVQLATFSSLNYSYLKLKMELVPPVYVLVGDWLLIGCL